MAQTDGAHDGSHNSDGFFEHDGEIYNSRKYYVDETFGPLERNIRTDIESFMGSPYQQQPHASGPSPPSSDASTSPYTAGTLYEYEGVVYDSAWYDDNLNNGVSAIDSPYQQQQHASGSSQPSSDAFTSPSSAEDTSASPQQIAEESTDTGNELEEELEGEVEEVDNRPIRPRSRGHTGKNKGRPPGSKNKPKVPDDGKPKAPKKKGRPPGAKNKHPKGYFRDEPLPQRDGDSRVVGKNDKRKNSGRATKRAVKKAPVTNMAAPVTNMTATAIDSTGCMAALMENGSVPPTQQTVVSQYMPVEFSSGLYPPRPEFSTTWDPPMAPPPQPIINYYSYPPVVPPPQPTTNAYVNTPPAPLPSSDLHSWLDPTLADMPPPPFPDTNTSLVAEAIEDSLGTEQGDGYFWAAMTE